MEKLKGLIHPDLHKTLTAVLSSNKKYKITDILFDKHIKTKRTNGELDWKKTDNEKDINYKNFKQVLIIVDVNIENVLLGILFNYNNKKAFKLIQLANVSGTKFVVSNIIEDKLYQNSEIYSQIQETIPKLQKLKDLDKSLRNLISYEGMPRITEEMLGVLQYAKNIPASTIRKAVDKLPKEIYANPIIVLIRINSYMYTDKLVDYLSTSSTLFGEISYIARLIEEEQKLKAALFNATLLSIKNPKRNKLVAFALTESNNKIDKTLNLIESINSYNKEKENGTGTKNDS